MSPEMIAKHEAYRQLMKERQEKWNALTEYEKRAITEQREAEAKQKDKERQAKYYQDNKAKLSAVHHEYYEKNKDIIIKKCQQYHETHKEEALARSKKWRTENSEKDKERKEEWYKENREAVLEKQKEKTSCGCGSTYRKIDWKAHQKTNVHTKWEAGEAK